jgi:translation initiation factor 3 subunit B
VFEEEDAVEETNISAELIALRKRLVDEWNTWRTQCEEEVSDRRKGKKAERRGEEVKEEIEVWIDEVIEQIEEVVE